MKRKVRVAKRFHGSERHLALLWFLTPMKEKISMMVRISFIFSHGCSAHDPKLYVLNGAKLGHVRFIGKKKKNYCKKNNDASWLSSSGRLIGGQNRAPAAHPLMTFSRRNSRHMLPSSQFFGSS